MTKIFNADLIGKPESVTEQILMLNPYQTPMLAMLGFAGAVNQVEHNWFEDAMFATETTTTASALIDATSIVVASVEPFRVNDVAKIVDELVKITAIDSGTKTLTVTRGYAGTTAAAVANGAVVEFQFTEGVEGADAIAARYKQRVRKSNITQIFTDTVEVTGTAAAVANYGISDIYAYEQAKKQLELALQLEKALINGIKYENGAVRQMAGVRSLISTNVKDAAGAALTLNMINDSLQSIYEKGGFATGGNYEIVVPAKQKRVVSSFSDEKVTIDQADERRGTIVSRLTTDFGQFPVSINDNLDSKEVLILDKNRARIRPLTGREFQHEYLGKKGDYYQGMLVGEFTLELHQEQAHARIKGLA
ncbi:DUF5309 domain-containing protein [Paenibacillus sp. 7124]|uniref:DUF5309 domain-containing protein n=1 Tax=Paenibacillus apii TaxID=1850370 RepID=A0A6M1PD68_9BACL|nr:DUF5309 family protein [Paenibacillus apii]NGM81199.1 DUF5309 domain-containing protein [Paenibacillus apii]